MEQIIAFFESLWEKITANWQLAAVIAAAVLLVLILIIAIACRARRKKKARQRQLARPVLGAGRARAEGRNAGCIRFPPLRKGAADGFRSGPHGTGSHGGSGACRKAGACSSD